MAKKQERKQLQNKLEAYSINLATVEGDGSFTCPRCGNSISPEDETENNYTILDTKVLNDDLVELVIACGKCKSKIALTGFQTIDA